MQKKKRSNDYPPVKGARIIAFIQSITLPSFVLTLFLFTLISCTKNEEVHQTQLFVFGTLVDISISKTSPIEAEKAFAAINLMFRGMHNDWHAWKPGKLVDLNKAINNGTCFDDAEISQLLQEALILENKSQHLFNPAIGKILNLWGFHTDTYPITEPPPTQQQITHYTNTQPSLNNLSFNGPTICSNNPDVAIDLGGFAKGVAVDRAMSLLKSMNINHAIVNAGGDLMTIGEHSNRPWNIAIRKPGTDQIIGAIKAQNNEAIFTSGTYARFLEFNGKRYPHIIDPRTGQSTGTTISATVIADSGGLADAAATALIVAGLDEWKIVAKGLNLDKVMLIDGNSTVYMTQSMKKRVTMRGQTQIIDLNLTPDKQAKN